MHMTNLISPLALNRQRYYAVLVSGDLVGFPQDVRQTSQVIYGWLICDWVSFTSTTQQVLVSRLVSTVLSA